MRRKILLILIFVMVLSLVFILNRSKTVDIIISEDGFKPQEVSINLGDNLKFTNQDSKAHWPASDIHPTHRIYPEFDSKNGILSGRSWQFRVKKQGIFKYHDHLSPHLKGIIYVKGKGEKENFHNLNSSSLGLSADETSLKKMSQEMGVKETWENFKEANLHKSQADSKIHDLAHFIGELIFENEGLYGLKICSSDFAFGCFHGLLDRAFVNGLDKINEAQQGCLNAGKQGSGPYNSCIHGIGHGVASFYLVSKLDEALNACKPLNKDREYCFDGVFMEFARNASANFYKRDNPLYPCDTILVEYLIACGRNQAMVMKDRFKFDFTEIGKTCLRHSSSDFKSACIDSLGFIIAQKSLGDADLIILECNKIEAQGFRAKCLRASAGEVIFQNMPNWRETSSKICSVLEGENSKTCKDYLETIKRDYNRV